MSLDPDAERVLQLIRDAGRPPLHAVTPQELRVGYKAGRRVFAPDPIDLAQVEDLAVPGPAGDIPVRLYRGRRAPPASAPCLVFLHGGGFCIGDLDTHDGVCRKIADAAACTVVSVDYRLAPEHTFPAGLEDCVAAVRWVAENAVRLGVDAARLAVGGDSAGGNLSAVLAHMARDGDLPALRYQLLLYPSVEMSMRHPSYRLDLSRFPLTAEGVAYFHGHYLRDAADQADWRASPMRAASHAGLAPAFILTAGYDPLRDEGAEYASLLETNGVPVTFVHLSDQMHGFLTMARMIRAADTALEMAAAALARGFAA